MLDRNKIAKQFELVVQQEIKNHNDQILTTNLAINSIQEKIAVHEKKQFLQASSLLDKLKIQDEKISSLEKSVSALAQEIECIKDSNKKIIIANEEILDIININNDKFKIDYSVISEKVFVLHKMLSDAKNQNEEMYKNFSFLMTSRDYKMTKELEKFKEEVLNKPSEIREVKKFLEEKIAINSIDVDGIMREIQHYKKAAHVVEKKIENIYTLIQRIQDGKI